MSFADDFIREVKKQSSRGRCLHYESSVRCDKIVSAHSIQRSGQLAHIAENGHVYRLNSDFSTLKKNNGKPMMRKVGLNRASAFAGFCGTHDNELFAPIDNFPLRPDAQQVALYAYRSLCREYFVKENAVRALPNLVNNHNLSPSAKDMLTACYEGNTIGFNNLKYHKGQYDQALLSKNYSDFAYTIFTSNSPCALQLSGLLHPNYDFTGGHLQTLGTEEPALDLITFFTAPIENGWSFGFAWHVSSSSTCEKFLGALAAAVHSGVKLKDALLRLSIACENHALRISWWDALPPDSKAALQERMLAFYPYNQFYLAAGCEGIADWSFEHVHTTLQPVRLG